MRVSLVLLWFCLSCVQLQRADDQLVVGDEQIEFTQSQIEELKKPNTGKSNDLKAPQTAFFHNYFELFSLRP